MRPPCVQAVDKAGCATTSRSKIALLAVESTTAPMCHLCTRATGFGTGRVVRHSIELTTCRGSTPPATTSRHGRQRLGHSAGAIGRLPTVNHVLRLPDTLIRQPHDTARLVGVL